MPYKQLAQWETNENKMGQSFSYIHITQNSELCSHQYGFFYHPVAALPVLVLHWNFSMSKARMLHIVIAAYYIVHTLQKIYIMFPLPIKILFLLMPDLSMYYNLMRRDSD